MKSHARTLLAALFVGVLVSVGCGDAEIGESCDTSGSRDDCEDGAICTNEDGRNVCRARCDDTPDCPAGHTCNGISGSNLKSCQPEKG
jgi:hypothetical protein